MRCCRWLAMIALGCFQPMAQAAVPLFSGYVDSSYNYLAKKHQFENGTSNRLYDIENDGFTLQQAALFMQVDPPQGLGGRFVAIGGRDANALATQGWNPYFGSQTLALDFPESYLSYSKDAIKFLAGIYSSDVGSEAYSYLANKNFSHSILDTVAEPGRHVGARVVITPNDHISWMAGVGNGWSTLESPSRLTRMEFGMNYKALPTLSTIVEFYMGPHGFALTNDTGTQSFRRLLNVMVNWQATDRLQWMVSADTASQSKAPLSDGRLGESEWRGMVAYLNYQWTDQWQTSLRGEVFEDDGGYLTGTNQQWREATFTIGYQCFKSLLLRAETRHDFSNRRVFLNMNHFSLGQNQQSFALEGLYTF